MHRNAVYEIFVDRFAGPDGGALQRVPENEAPWHHHCGGSLDGVVQRLDHIQALGADVVYLTPIFRAASNHKYDAASYSEVDPRFGGIEAFDRLAAACRQRGMGLVLDGVFNHVGSEHDWYQNARAGNGHAKHRSHFKWDEQTGDCTYWRGHRSLPELDLAEPAVRHELFEAEEAVLRRWLRRGATGWRLDCANDLGLEHCRAATAAAHRESPRDGVVGEIMAYAAEWLEQGHLDGVMNYYFRQSVLSLVSGEIQAIQAAWNFERMAASYPFKALLKSWNILASHDTPRLATLVPDAARRRFATVLAWTFPGVPMIYYGEEIGMLGGHDPDCRHPMIWDESQWDRTALQQVLQLNQLRSSQQALASGRYVPMAQPGAPQMLVFARVTQNPAELVLLLGNASDEPYEGRLFLPYSHLYDGLSLFDLLEEEDPVVMSSGSVRVHLPPWSVGLYTPSDTTPNYSFFRS